MIRRIAAALLFLLLPGIFVSADARSENMEDELRFITLQNEPLQIDSLAYTAFTRLGYYISVETQPQAQAAAMMNAGSCDGIITLAEALAHEDTVKVPKPVGRMIYRAVSRIDSTIEINSWDDFRGFRVGIRFYDSYSDKFLPSGVSRSYYETGIELQNALAAGDIDIAVTAARDGFEPALMNGLSRCGIADNPETYIYLKKSHAELAEVLASELRKMDEDGTAEQIMSGGKNTSQGKKVLHISSYQPGNIWDFEIENALRKVFERDKNISYVNVPMFETRYYTAAERAKNAYSDIRTMYMSEPPDIIIATDNSAAEFTADNYSLLFKDIPVIITGANELKKYAWQLGGNHASINETIRAADTMELMLKLYPEATGVYVINDFTETGLWARAEIEKQLEPYENKINISYNGSDASAEAVINDINRLPENTLVLMGHFASERKDIFRTLVSIQDMFGKDVQKPVFSLFYIGQGQLGGCLIKPGALAKKAAETAVEVLTGKKIVETQSIENTGDMNGWIFDREAMKKYGIKKEALPENSTVINQPPGLRDLDPLALRLLIAVAFLAAIFICTLLYYFFAIRKKKKILSRFKKSFIRRRSFLKKTRKYTSFKKD